MQALITLVFLFLVLKVLFRNMTVATYLFAGFMTLLLAPVGSTGSSLLSLAIIFGFGYLMEARAERAPDPQRWVDLGIPFSIITLIVLLAIGPPAGSLLCLAPGFVSAFSLGAYIRGRRLLAGRTR